MRCKIVLAYPPFYAVSKRGWLVWSGFFSSNWGKANYLAIGPRAQSTISEPQACTVYMTITNPSKNESSVLQHVLLKEQDFDYTWITPRMLGSNLLACVSGSPIITWVVLLWSRAADNSSSFFVVLCDCKYDCILFNLPPPFLRNACTHKHLQTHTQTHQAPMVTLGGSSKHKADYFCSDSIERGNGEWFSTLCQGCSLHLWKIVWPV